MIGVCIKYFHENYGGMLQALATTAYFQKIGLEYELIRYEKCYNFIEKIKQIPRLLNSVLLNDKKEVFLKKIGAKRHPHFQKNDAIRMRAFAEFKDKHFTSLSPIFRGYAALRNGAKRYSAVVSGSDQLWSPAGLPTNFYNLMFVPEGIRKISIASSFGVKYIPWYQKKRTASFLKRIDFISMRENRGSELVEGLTTRKVPTILDPVFFLNDKEWNDLIPFKREFEEPYIFAYFLGADESYRAAVRAVARKYNCKIIALRHLDQYVPNDENFGDYAPYDVDPARFLNLLRGASYICTDSFHGTCFSVIFKKSFVIFNRYSENSRHSKNSRIDSLCDNLNLQNRRYKNVFELEKQLKESIDYSAVAERFVKWQTVTNSYLHEAFDGVI